MLTRVIVALASFGAACACASDEMSVDPTYDQTTGKLTQLTADLNKDGVVDTWTYMDGALPLRTEQDLNGDGKVERWEFPGPDGKAVKVAVSRRNTGKPDMWTYLDAAGEPERIESASVDLADSGKDRQQPLAKIDRIETFSAGRLVRVAEDTDSDGRMDKWEHHEGSVLMAVEYDRDRDGKPDERVLFGSGGKVLSVQQIR